MCGTIPERCLEQPRSAHLLDGVIVQAEFADLVAAGSEQRGLDADDFVFAARLLIVVVDYED